MDKPTVLIIDDEQLFLSSYSFLLEKDFNVLTAPNGREGLLKFKSNPLLSLILLDLNMPVMNGIETLKAIRASDDKIKVVIMTGVNIHEWAEQCADLAIQGYIKKPLDPDELLARIKKLTIKDCDEFFRALWGDDYPQKIASFSPLVRKAIALVDEKFSKQIDREKIAACLKVSPDHVTKRFTKECGFQLSRYINERRIYESKILLSGTVSIKISDVARMVGIEDNNYFAKIFKIYTGITPREYIKTTTFP